MTGATSAVIIRGLTVERGARTVLDHFDLDLASGCITGLLGPSGCGKTTLMRAIVGVQRTRAGDVRVLGLPAGSPALRSVVAYVTQAPSVYSDLTVRENLRYFARVLGARGADVDRAIAEVRLGDFAGQVAGRLSGGQRSRLSLATALLNRPQLLVLDEPTVGLDPVLRRELWDTFHGLSADGATLLVSSHVMDEAERCDRLVLMREGRVVAHDEPRRLLEAAGSSSMEEAFLVLAGAVGVAK